MESSSSMSLAQPWTTLHEWYIGMLRRPAADRPSSHEMASHFVADGWVRSDVARRATLTLLAQGEREDSADEVAQEVFLILVETIRKDAYLGTNLEFLEQRFAHWVGGMIRNACRYAIRRLPGGSGSSEPIPAMFDLMEPSSDPDFLERQLVVYDQIAGMEEPQRTVLLLYGQGYSVVEISVRLEIGRQRVYRALRKGLDEIRDERGEETRG